MKGFSPGRQKERYYLYFIGENVNCDNPTGTGIQLYERPPLMPKIQSKVFNLGGFFSRHCSIQVTICDNHYMIDLSHQNMLKSLFCQIDIQYLKTVNISVKKYVCLFHR